MQYINSCPRDKKDEDDPNTKKLYVFAAPHPHNGVTSGPDIIHIGDISADWVCNHCTFMSQIEEAKIYVTDILTSKIVQNIMCDG